MARATPAVSTAVLCCVELVGVMGATLVITLLPSMLAGTGSTGAVGSAAVATGYAVGFGGFLVLGARLADRWGHVRAVVLAAAVFAAAGVALVAAPTAWLLGLARLVQGVAAAVMVPAALALITRTVPEGPARRRALAAWGATSAAGGALGFLVGSGAAALGRWQAAFLLQVALSAGMAALVAWLWRGDRASSPAPRPGSLDLPGGLLITATLGLVVAGTSLLTTHPPLAAVLLLAAAATGAGAGVTERRAAEPVLPVATLRRPRVGVGSAVAFVNTATTSSAATLLTLALQAGGHASAAVTALTMLPFSVAVIAGSGLAPRLMGRWGDPATCAAGLLGIGVGVAGLPLALAHLPWVAVCLALAGLGVGLSAAGSTHLGTGGPGDDQAPAAALLNTAAQLGTALGVGASLACAQLTGPAAVWWGLAVLGVGAAAAVRRVAGGCLAWGR